MLDSIVTLDTALFRFVNHDLANPVFDVVMPVITNATYLFVPYLLLLVMLLWKGGARGRWCVALILLGVALSDPINSRIVKELVERVRPCAALPDVRLLVPCGAGKSFPSTHAVNNFVAAFIIGYFYRRWLPLALCVASAIGFSRIYVGVHYPFDVIGGAALGAVIAGAVLLLWVWARRMKGAGELRGKEEVKRSG